MIGEWEFPFCNCDGQEAPFGKRGFFCDECGREIAVREPVPMCDFNGGDR